MNNAALVARMLHDEGTACTVAAPGGDAAPVLMVVQRCGTGSIHPRYSALSFVDKSVLQKGTEWAYGLLPSADAPEGMGAEMRLVVTDSTGKVWTAEFAKAMHDICMETRCAVVVAWRMALRGNVGMRR